MKQTVCGMMFFSSGAICLVNYREEKSDNNTRSVKVENSSKLYDIIVYSGTLLLDKYLSKNQFIRLLFSGSAEKDSFSDTSVMKQLIHPSTGS